MMKRITALVMAACVMIQVTACGGNTNMTTSQTSVISHATKVTEGSFDIIDPIAEEDAYRTVTLYCLEAGEQYSFRYDSDILEYTGQGGDFYLVGSTSTKCYLHLIVQNWEEESYDSVRSAASDSIIEDFTLESGRRAFGYAGSVENTYHAVIDAEGIVPSGNGMIKIYLGSINSWPYSCEQIISMVDSGF